MQILYSADLDIVQELIKRIYALYMFMVRLLV